jgi:hypothetical protein
MPKPRVYVETTIPSFYYDQRKDPAIVQRRIWTREWWEHAQNEYELVTGAPVLAELLAGITSRVALRLRLVSELPILVPDDRVDQTVHVYVQHKLMPSRPLEDAQHVAIASHNRCDFIVTWNCKHLANPNKARHLARINSMLGLHVPAIVTPLDLLGRER